MKYQYTYRTTAWELWQLSMYYTYGSMVGMCNIIFTAAVFALLVAKWDSSSGFFKLFLILGCCLFPLIQPLMIYRKAQKQAAEIQQDTQIGFDESGVHIQLGEKNSDIPWSSIRRISKKPTMMVVFSDSVHGFVLTNRVLGKERKACYDYISKRIH
ncbi:MAG: YcxB family protein [Hungatella sp.]